MKGADHYREAERLLAVKVPGPLSIGQAQVHATLALAAATVETAYAVATHGDDGAIQADWVEVTS